MKTDAYYKGYDAKNLEIDQLGWSAARDEFNRIHPLGHQYSAEGLQYANGEFDALFDRMPKSS